LDTEKAERPQRKKKPVGFLKVRGKKIRKKKGRSFGFFWFPVSKQDEKRPGPN